MNQSLGKLPNAPLIYVLAQIKFSRVPKMGEHWEDIHQRIFDEYPESEIEHVAQLAMEKEGLVNSPAEARWHLLSRDRRKGILLNPSMLIFHTTSYEASNKFFDDLSFVLSKLIDVIPTSVQTNRLGLRYVDMLLPQNNLGVDKQVVDKLGMSSLEDIECIPVRFERVANYKTPIGGELTLRNRQCTGTNVLPSDLFPNILKPAPLLNEEKQPDSIVGLLDFDHHLKTEIPLETDTVIDIFRELQKTTSAAFQAVTTTAAKAVWK